MKVIERGRVPDEAIHVIRCHTCSTKFEFERMEGRVVDDPAGLRVEIECPVCRMVNSSPFSGPNTVEADRIRRQLDKERKRQ